MGQSDIAWLASEGPQQIAFQALAGSGPTVVWLGGFKSDMTGAKASRLAAWAAKRGQAYVRFDYRGHGRSGGDFEQLGIGDWRADALAVITALTNGPAVLVGSSMGGWMALLAALAQPKRIAGLVLIAPAPDFTQRLIWDGFSPDIRQAIETTGRYERPSSYGDGPYVITRGLIESGARHALLHAPIPIQAPVRILHGMADADVPWRLSLELAERIESPDVRLTFIKAGDHRLSTEADLTRLERELEALLADLA
jgi:pimeloyl-ACP methyl ester carboxylesterase